MDSIQARASGSDRSTKEVWPTINTPLIGIPFNDCTSLSPNLTIQKTFDKMFMPYANMQVQEKNEKKSTNGWYSYYKSYTTRWHVRWGNDNDRAQHSALKTSRSSPTDHQTGLRNPMPEYVHYFMGRY